MKYKKHYGHNFPRKPDLSLCAAEVYDRSGIGFYQCSKKAKHDPDENGKPTTCGIHCESKVKDRQAKADERYKTHKAKWDRRSAERQALIACERIAEGHNDPRALAQSVVDMLEVK